MLEKGAIVPEANSELNSIYEKYAPPPPGTPYDKETHDTDSGMSSTGSSTNEEIKEEKLLLLTRDAVPAITEVFDSRPDSSLAADIYRALEQAALRLRSHSKDGPNSR